MTDFDVYIYNFFLSPIKKENRNNPKKKRDEKTTKRKNQFYVTRSARSMAEEEGDTFTVVCSPASLRKLHWKVC